MAKYMIDCVKGRKRLILEICAIDEVDIGDGAVDEICSGA